MGSKITIGGRTYYLPKSRLVRTVVGFLLIALGIVGFLPVVGFWMIPLGLFILSADWPIVRRLRRRVALWWARKNNKSR